MTRWMSAFSPASSNGVPTLPLLILLIYAVTISVIGASVRHLETKGRAFIELTYAASTLDKDLASLMRDAQAMVSAPSALRMQALLINLEEYETALDEVRLLSGHDEALRPPLQALEQTLPAIRQVILQAARMDGDRSGAAIEDQALALTRLDAQMQARIGDIESRLEAAPSAAGELARRLTLLSWVIHALAIAFLSALIFGALRASRPSDMRASIAE